MKSTPFLIAALIASFTLSAQLPAPPKGRQDPILSLTRPLTIGDTVANPPVHSIINYPLAGKGLPGFGRKLLILDFMTTNCVPCIEALPRMDSLQQQFAGKLQIILVTPEPATTVTTFWQKNRIARQSSLPIITGDSLLQKLFVHEYKPHEVWIDKDGIVKAITVSQYVNASNIQQVINGKKINWPIKRDLTDYDPSQPLVAINGADIPVHSYPDKKYYSILTGHMAGVTRYGSPYDPGRKTEFVTDTINQAERFVMINYPILHLYLKAWDQHLNFPVSRIVLEVSDRNRFIYDAAKEYPDVWEQRNTYSYEAVLPAGMTHEEKKRKMRNDLEFYLGFKAAMEKRKMKCLVMTRTGQSDSLLRRSPGKPAPDEAGNGVIDVPLPNLMYRANHLLYGLPVLDETGYKERRYIYIKEKDIANVELLIKAMTKYGLELREEEREVEVFVLREVRKSESR